MKVSLLGLLLVVLGARAWVVQQMYLDSKCTDTALISTQVLSGTCQKIAYQYIRFTCAGSDIIAQTCFDSDCVNCQSVQLSTVFGGAAGTCVNLANSTGVDGVGFGLKFECSSKFPTTDKGDLITELYFGQGCSNTPFSWTITPSSLTVGVSTCAGIQNGICVGSTNQQAGISVYQKVYCSGFSAPSGPGNGPQNCTIDGNSCGFYWGCMENTLACAATDYALGVGYENCITYEQNMPSLSLQGQLWLTDVNKCMQTVIKSAVTASGATCASVRTTAFASHVQCYFNTETCFPPQDWSVAMSVAYDSSINADGTVSALTNTGCFKDYHLAGVWLLSNIQSGGYRILLQEIAALAGVNYSSIAILDSTTNQYTWKVQHTVRGFGLGGGGVANITFAAYAPNATAAAQIAVTFNANFENQTMWSGAHATSCSAANPAPCAATKIQATYGAEPPNDNSKSSTSSFVVASALVIISLLVLL